MNVILAIFGGWRSLAFAALAALAVGAYGIEHVKAARADAMLAARIAADAKADADAQIVARTREYEAAIASAQIASDYERAKHDAQTTADSVVADLRAGTLRLREQWRGCQADVVSTIAAAAAGADAAEQRRRDSAGAIVRAATACDAQVTGLQRIVVADRAGQSP